jgi:flagellar basal body-associated protein FliL
MSATIAWVIVIVLILLIIAGLWAYGYYEIFYKDSKQSTNAVSNRIRSPPIATTIYPVFTSQTPAAQTELDSIPGDPSAST